MRPRRLPAVLLLAAFVPAAGAAAELHGRLALVTKAGKAAGGSDLQQAVVYFDPAASHGVPPASRPIEMVTRQKEFVPRVLVVSKGTRVRFPNQDPILHNVFSVTPENAFDLGLVPKGPGKEQRLDKPGLVRVFCNVHHAMVAYVLVLETPYYTRPDALGNFTLSGLPPGRGRLTVWHEQAEPWTVETTLPYTGLLAARLEVTRPRIPPHLNKLGRAYSTRGIYGGN
jgi:plastocyanin